METAQSSRNRTSQLRSLYDKGYFHGVNSGYPEEGYAANHPDWAEWLKRIQNILGSAGPSQARWLDLGCAYGYLVEEARAAGFHVMGCDISRYALSQRPGIRGYLTEADAFDLPFRSESLDLVTAFDLLEHLENPRRTAAELKRCLKPDAVLIAATPDPCRFLRREPTHVHERPPAHWIELFKEIGFHCNFGFEGEDFNFVLAASKAKEKVAGFHKQLLAGAKEPFSVSDTSAAPVAFRVRTGFHETKDGWMLGEKNEIYVYNPSVRPVSISIDCSAGTTGHNGAFLLVADGRVAGRVEFFSHQNEISIQLAPLLFANGGHSIRFDLAEGKDAGQVIIRSLSFDARQSSRDELISRLPFDLFERYQASALMCRGISPAPQSILDYGGYIGDRGGHWASAADFGVPAVFTDVRAADSAFFVPSDELSNKSFDLVLCLDVLEHIPGAERTGFLEKLDSMSKACILIGGPFSSTDVVDAESQVRTTLEQSGADSHGFLNEHQEKMLPERELLLEWAAAKGYRLVEYQGMCVEMWAVLQETSLLLAHFQQHAALERLNRAVNMETLWSSEGRPYRLFFLISKREMLNTPVLPRSGRGLPSELLAFLKGKPEILSADTVRRRMASAVLLNEKQKHIQLLQNQVELLQNHVEQLQQKAEMVDQLQQRILAVEQELQMERQTPIARIFWKRLKKRLKTND